MREPSQAKDVLCARPRPVKARFAYLAGAAVVPPGALPGLYAHVSLSRIPVGRGGNGGWNGVSDHG
jgi:hypothetical protein